MLYSIHNTESSISNKSGVCVCPLISMPARTSENNLWEPVLTFYHESPGIERGPSGLVASTFPNWGIISQALFLAFLLVTSRVGSKVASALSWDKFWKIIIKRATIYLVVSLLKELMPPMFGPYSGTKSAQTPRGGPHQQGRTKPEKIHSSREGQSSRHLWQMLGENGLCCSRSRGRTGLGWEVRRSGSRQSVTWHLNSVWHVP